MKHEFTKREKVLLVFLGVLLLGLLYYKFLLTPINDKITSIQSDMASDQTLIDTSMPQMIKLNKMKTELETLKNSGDSQPLPEYDNSKKLMDELHLILSGASSYTLNFNSTTEADAIVRRPIVMSFTAGSYQAARAIIDRLHQSSYTNQIADLAFSTDDENGVQVNLTITFYELDSNYTPPAATAATDTAAEG